MTSSNLSAREFCQLAVNSLLELCTNHINGHRIVSIEGRLLLTLDAGDKVAVDILQQTLYSSLNSVEDDLEDTSFSQVVADEDNNFDGVQSVNVEPVQELEDNVGLESPNNLLTAHCSGAQSCSYHCEKCNVSFASHTLINNHRVMKHYTHKCQQCSFSFVGRQSFVEHVKKEHPGLPICKAVKSLVCEYCSQTFAFNKALSDHIATVHLGAVHRCEQCGKVLGSAVTLRIHKRQLHQNAQQQTCDGCGRQFARLASLISHLTYNHPHLLPEKYRHRLDDLYCKECNLSFSRYNSLNRHMEVRHGHSPKFMCVLCTRRFSCRRYVLRHIRAYHPAIAHVNRSSMIVNIGDDSSVVITRRKGRPLQVSVPESQ